MSTHYDVIIVGTGPGGGDATTISNPYYTQAEHLYYVHGNRGEDPTEPKASAPYKYPAMRHEPRIQELHNDWVRIGYRPFRLPVGMILAGC